MKSMLNAKDVTMSSVRRWEWSSMSMARLPSSVADAARAHASQSNPTLSSTLWLNCSSEKEFMNGFWHISLCSRLYDPSLPVIPLFLMTYRKASGSMRSL